MASVNKQSLREELAALKVRFDTLCADGKMGAESRALIEALLLLLELLVAVFLEKNTAKTNTNSSKPPSQIPTDESALSRPGKHGKGKALTEARCANTRTVQSVQLAAATFCECCGEDLRKVPCREHERRTRIDIVISEATILKYVMQLHQALERWEHEAIERLLTCPAMHLDETSLRVDRNNHWIHVCCAQDITLKFLHPKRGQQAMRDIAVIPRYAGVIIHDCWASYLAYEHCHHGLCGAHLLRELTFIVDADGHAWAKNMKRLLQQTCRRVAKRKRKKLTEREYARLQKHYRNILTRGDKELPPIPPRQNGKRGRIAKSDAHNLWQRLKQHERAVLLFASHPHVSFTNNRAERDLRMSKVKQKVSGCFRKPEYAQAYCRISSYLQSMANRGYNPLVAIQMALSGQLYSEGGE